MIQSPLSPRTPSTLATWEVTYFVETAALRQVSKTRNSSSRAAAAIPANSHTSPLPAHVDGIQNSWLLGETAHDSDNETASPSTNVNANAVPLLINESLIKRWSSGTWKAIKEFFDKLSYNAVASMYFHQLPVCIPVVVVHA